MVGCILRDCSPIQLHRYKLKVLRRRRRRRRTYTIQQRHTLLYGDCDRLATNKGFRISCFNDLFN